jgi:arginine repressor
MVYLAEILKGKLHFNKSIYEITVNTTKLSRVINYLNIHRLKTDKSVVYLNFRKTYLLIKNKKSLTNEEIKLLSRYKNNLNRLDSKLS